MLGPGGADGITALDLYAGTGAVGFDLLEHGAAHVDFVEIDGEQEPQKYDKKSSPGTWPTRLQPTNPMPSEPCPG